MCGNKIKYVQTKDSHKGLYTKQTLYHQNPSNDISHFSFICQYNNTYSNQNTYPSQNTTSQTFQPQALSAGGGPTAGNTGGSGSGGGGGSGSSSVSLLQGAIADLVSE